MTQQANPTVVTDLATLKSLVRESTREAVRDEYSANLGNQVELHVGFTKAKEALREITGGVWTNYMLNKYFDIVKRKGDRPYIKASQIREYERVYRGK